jgi:MoaA/NifB/PqqE/SkfB family radical SAM enzyme
MNAKKYSSLKIFHFPEKIRSLPPENPEVRPPLHIRLKPTNFCNHACSYCAYRQPDTQIGQDMNERDFIPWEVMEGFLEDIAAMGVQAVTLSGGGEPLCYPFIDRTLGKLAATDIRFAMLTNGSLLSGKAADLLAAFGSWVRVSIDGWDADSYARYRRVGTDVFPKVMDNMAAFARRGQPCQLGVSFIIDHDNAPHVFTFAQKLKDLGVKSLKVSPCIVSNMHADCNRYHREIFNSVREQVERVLAELAGPEFEVFDAYHELDEKFDKPYHWCPFLQVQPVVGADQNIYACHDKAYNIAGGRIGSLREGRFRDVWMSGKKRFTAIDPARDCRHHCCNNKGNKLVLEYLAAAASDHIRFV